MNYRGLPRGIVFCLACHSVLDTESRVPGENREPVFEMVPDFRRDDVWIPAFACLREALRRRQAGMTN